MERTQIRVVQVLPKYMDFPSNAIACNNITKPKWNPPAWVMKRWVEICMA